MSDRLPSYHSDGEFPNRLDPNHKPLKSSDESPHPKLPLTTSESLQLPIASDDPTDMSGSGYPKQTIPLALPPKPSESLPKFPRVVLPEKYSLSNVAKMFDTPEDHIPIVSVIVAAPPGMQELKSVNAAQNLAYPKSHFEIIVARGKQPSVQRNRAVKEAKGSLIYFLDDDSEPYKENLIRGVELFMDEQVQVVGGPNLVPPDSNLLERSFGDAMGSWLAFGPSCARYRKVGKTRSSSEKELILCNMMFRKTAFEKHGGFDEALYPNEENALMDAIAGDGGKLMYDPEFVVNRRPRQSLCAFAKMLMNYGRGRAEQFRLHPTIGSAPNFVPPIFLLYLLAAPFLPLWGLWPLAAYAAVVILQVLAIDLVFPLSLPRLAPLILLSHVFYGAGFWKGLFTQLKPKNQPSNVSVDLERIGPA